MTNKVEYTRNKKGLFLIGLTLAWLPLAYALAYFSQFDIWYMKATTLIAAFLFAGSLLSLICAITIKDSIFHESWKAKLKNLNQ